MGNPSIQIGKPSSSAITPIYAFANDWTDLQNRNHWTPNNINLTADVAKWKGGEFTEEDKNIIAKILTFFVPIDVDVGNHYFLNLYPFTENQELRQMFTTFGYMETIHSQAYAKLAVELGIFHEINKFVTVNPLKKIEHLEERKPADMKTLLLSIASFGLFAEGLQLFSAFALLLHFARTGSLGGMKDIIDWSMRDETIHVHAMANVFNVVEEDYLINAGAEWHTCREELQQDILNEAEKQVSLEHEFIEHIFNDNSSIRGLKKQDLQAYIKYLANDRLQLIDYPILYANSLENPMLWVEEFTNSTVSLNFFDRNSHNYSQGFSGSLENAL